MGRSYDSPRYDDDEDDVPFGYIPDDADFDEGDSDSGDDLAPARTGDASEDLLSQCEAALGHVFQNRQLLIQALTHSSVARTRSDSNERMEFLGDAVIGTVVCVYLFETYPDFDEGDMTRVKSAVVSRHTCSQFSEQLRLDRFLRVGKGLSVHERIPGSILACAFESVVAALYLDGGWDVVRLFLLTRLIPEIERVAGSTHGHNFKSQLQQLAQKRFGLTPLYRTLDEKGPDHSKCFQIAATIGQRHYPAAWGPNKKDAEQNAARNALEQIQSEPPPAKR